MSNNEPDHSKHLPHIANLTDYAVKIESEDGDFITEIALLEIEGVELEEVVKSTFGGLHEVRAYLEAGKDMASLLLTIVALMQSRKSLSGKKPKAKVRTKKKGPKIRSALKELESLMEVTTEEDISADDTESED